MLAILKGFRRHALNVLGLDAMNDKFRVLTVNYVYLMLYYTLESVFVNTLLYRISPEMTIVMGYRAVVYLFTALAMNVASYLSRRYSPVLVIKLGGFSYIMMYVILFVGMDRMDVLRHVVAAFSGMGAGLYWGGHNVLLTHYTDRRSRALGLSILGVVQGVMTLLVPVVSGFVISLMPGSLGYRVMFGLGMLTVLLQRRLQNQLSPVDMGSAPRASEYRLAFKCVWRKATCKLMLGYEFIRGLRDGIFTFFLNMVLFELITQEALVGINTFLTGFMAIAGSWAYGKLAGPGKRVPYALLSTTILLGFNALLFPFPNAFMVMLFSLVNAFFNLFIIYTFNTYSYDVLGQNETMRRCLGEMSGLRESAISAGRLVGLWIVLQFPDNLAGYIQAMCVLTVAQYIGVLLVKLTKDTLDRKQIRRVSKQY